MATVMKTQPHRSWQWLPAHCPFIAANSQFDCVLLLCSTMGTDLALDVCGVLPLGLSKYIVRVEPCVGNRIAIGVTSLGSSTTSPVRDVMIPVNAA